jgi:hypothetical protein
VRVRGNQLVDAAGQPVRLVGVSHSGTESECLAGASVLQGPEGDALAGPMLAWGINAVRLPLNETCWLGINGVPAATSGAAYRARVEGLVRGLRARGLYVLLDLHWTAPGGGIASGLQPMPDADHAGAFWASVASVFGGDEGVVFDLFNEPYLDAAAAGGDAWGCWQHGCTVELPGGAWRAAGMQELVDAVRAAGARNVVLVGGLSYANDLSRWSAHAPKDPLSQMAAAFHVYNFSWPCTSADCWAAIVARVAARVPVVTAEVGENDCGHGFVDEYLRWADAAGLSYLAWTWNPWDCAAGPALIRDYDGSPTPYGAGLREHMLRQSAGTRREGAASTRR